MLVKFTNSFNELQGMPLYINPDHVASVYEKPTNGGSLATCIYGSKGEIWLVEESLSETIKIINGVIK
jgi:uncharacterized protein YlzI (FlbEa/FlbD family)